MPHPLSRPPQSQGAETTPGIVADLGFKFANLNILKGLNMFKKETNPRLFVTGHEVRGEGENELVVILFEEYVENDKGGITTYSGNIPFNGRKGATIEDALKAAKRMYPVDTTPFSGGILSVPVDEYEFDVTVNGETETRTLRHGPRYLPAKIYRQVLEGDYTLYFEKFARRFENGRNPDWWDSAHRVEEEGEFGEVDFSNAEVPVPVKGTEVEA